MLDYLQRPKPEGKDGKDGKDDFLAPAAIIEPLHVILAKKKGKVFETPSKN